MAKTPIKPERVPEDLEQNENDEGNEDYSFSFDDHRSHNSSQPIVPAIRTLHSAFVRRRSFGNRVGHRLTAWHIARLQATILQHLVDSGPNAVLGAEASNESNADYGATSDVAFRARIGRWSEEVGYETWAATSPFACRGAARMRVATRRTAATPWSRRLRLRCALPTRSDLDCPSTSRGSKAAFSRKQERAW